MLALTPACRSGRKGVRIPTLGRTQNASGRHPPCGTRAKLRGGARWKQRRGFIIVLHWLFQEVDDEVDVGDVVDVFGVVHACCSSSSTLPFLSYLLTRVWIRSIIVIIIQYYAGLHRHLRTLSCSLLLHEVPIPAPQYPRWTMLRNPRSSRHAQTVASRRW